VLSASAVRGWNGRSEKTASTGSEKSSVIRNFRHLRDVVVRDVSSSAADIRSERSRLSAPWFGMEGGRPLTTGEVLVMHRSLTAVTVALALVAAACGTESSEPSSATTSTTPTTIAAAIGTTTSAPVVFATLGADGLGDGMSFGADGDAVAATLTSVFGPPTDTSQLELVPVTDPSSEFAWGDDEDLPFRMSKFPHIRLTCWVDLCVTDVSSDAAEWIFSGWEHRMLESGDTYLTLETRAGLAVGDPYERLLELYPGATISGGEGASVGFQLPSWPEAGDGAVAGNGRLQISVAPFDPDLVPADTPIQSIFSSDGSTGYGCC
jgi:hypothetical protein